jgi:hypothetical protein
MPQNDSSDFSISRFEVSQRDLHFFFVWLYQKKLFSASEFDRPNGAQNAA